MYGTTSVYKFLLLAHILSAIIAFGPWFLNGLFPTFALKRSQTEGQAVNSANLNVSTLTQFAMYGVVIFGFAVIGAKAKGAPVSMSKPWVGIALVVWIAIVGLLHGVILPAQRALKDGTGDREALTRRQSLGAAGIEVLVVVAVYLMVFRPGQ